MTLTYAEIQAKAAELGPLLPAPQPTVRDVRVGWSLSEKQDPSTWYEARGGVVYHVVPNGSPVPDTGELVDRYVLVKVHRGELRWVSLGADQVAAVDDGNRPNAHTIQGVCQVAARRLVAQLDRKRGTPDTEEVLDLFTLGARLYSVLARPGTVVP